MVLFVRMIVAPKRITIRIKMAEIRPLRESLEI